MDRGSKEVAAAERARWLAKLASTIDEAQKLAWRLGVSEGDNPEAKTLYARLEDLREEVDALRRGSWTGTRQEIDPVWMQLLPWQPGTRSRASRGDERT